MSKKELPKGCFEFIDHKRITSRDINHDRPTDQSNVSCERAIAHRAVVEKRWGLFKGIYWVALSTTTYEMSGQYFDTYMGGRAWAETDKTGLEWRFHSKEDAENFAIKSS